MTNGQLIGPRRAEAEAGAPAAGATGTVELVGPDRRQVWLAPEADAPGLARAMVTDACHAWDLPRLLHPARLVMSELALNAVEHAGTSLIAAVERRGAELYLAVSDGAVRPPRLRGPAVPRDGAPLDDRGLGLWTVQATAAAWGATTTTTGKVVWAVLR